MRLTGYVAGRSWCGGLCCMAVRVTLAVCLAWMPSGQFWSRHVLYLGGLYFCTVYIWPLHIPDQRLAKHVLLQSLDFKGRPPTCHPCRWGAFLSCFAAACAVVAYYLVICRLAKHNQIANKCVAVWLLLGFWERLQRAWVPCIPASLSSIVAQSQMATLMRAAPFTTGSKPVAGLASKVRCTCTCLTLAPA